VKILIKTVNPVTLNFAESVLKQADIVSFVMDTHVSILEGSIGAIPRRIMVIDEDYEDACKALQDAGLGEEIFEG